MSDAFAFRTQDGVLFVTFQDKELREPVTINAAGRQLQEKIRQEKPTRMIISFDGVRCLYSWVIDYIYGVKRLLDLSEGRVALYNIPPQILAVFFYYNPGLQIVTTEESALAFVAARK